MRTIPTRPAPATPPRALWIWGESRELLKGGGSGETGTETAAQRAFFRFIAAPHGRADRAITTLYLGGIRREALSSPAGVAEVRGFLTACHRRGLNVEFLCGDSSWARAERHDDALGHLRAVLAYNRAAGAAARFDGFQYDVEPYLLKEWPAPGLRRDFLRLFERAKAEAAEGAPRGASRLVLGAALPFWFDQEKFGRLDRAVLDRLDYVALMDYVNNPTALIERAANEIAYAGKVGKRVVIGVETQALKEEPMATFFAEGNAAMERALSAAERHYGNGKSAGFGGFAIHFLASYRTFAP
jgi:hypothetical protein